MTFFRGPAYDAPSETSPAGGLSGKRAVYPGMFDPIHNGHIDVIQRSLRIFDELIVAWSPIRQEPLFSVQERMEMIDEATADLKNNFRIVALGLLIDLVARERADCIVQGIRAVSDFEYEFQMALMNRKALQHRGDGLPDAPREVHVYCLRLIKEVAGYGASVAGLVPPVVEKRLVEKFPPSRRPDAGEGAARARGTSEEPRPLIDVGRAGQGQALRGAST